MGEGATDLSDETRDLEDVIESGEPAPSAGERAAWDPADTKEEPAGAGSLLEPRGLLRRAEEGVGRLVDRVLAPVRGARALFVPPWRRPPKK